MKTKSHTIKKTVKHDGFVLEYLIFGKGSKSMLALHGHAKSAEDYFFLEEELKDYKIIALNLFFHGGSKLPDSKDFSHTIKIDEWMALIKKLFEEEQLNQFSLVAYSLGGRWALNILQFFPDQVKEVVLMAPDGLNKNGWYHRSSGSSILRYFFKVIVKRPQSFLIILRGLKKVRLVSERLYQFLMHHLETREKREKAYRTWMMYRNLFPNHKHINKIIKNHKYEKHLILGRYDAIISLKHSQRFLKMNEGLIKTHIIDSGHDFFKEDRINKIKGVIVKALDN